MQLLIAHDCTAMVILVEQRSQHQKSQKRKEGTHDRAIASREHGNSVGLLLVPHRHLEKHSRRSQNPGNCKLKVDVQGAIVLAEILAQTVSCLLKTPSSSSSV